MSQIFDKKENVIPVTVIEAGPCFVTQIKSQDKDNYSAVQIGYEKLKDKKISKSKKKKPYRYLREIRLNNRQQTKSDLETADNNKKFKIGDEIIVDVFEEGDVVKVSGISKGKGFQGVVKRHGFSGGPASHGHRHVLRTPGSIGSAFPQRVVKGKKMPGHAGAERVTTTGLKIVKIDKENNLLAVKGAIPGPNNGLVEIKSQ